MWSAIDNLHKKSAHGREILVKNADSRNPSKLTNYDIHEGGQESTILPGGFMFIKAWKLTFGVVKMYEV